VNTIPVKIKLLSEKAKIPTRGSEYSAGYDLYSTENHILKAGERKLFKTNISIQMPNHVYGRIAPRSGLAYKNGIIINGGVIDADYQGDIGVIMYNSGNKDLEIKESDRIAQIIFEFYNVANFIQCEQFDVSERGDGSFGSTGK
jgi:dUTP pyrophosphatase